MKHPDEMVKKEGGNNVRYGFKHIKGLFHVKQFGFNVKFGVVPGLNPSQTL